MRKSSMYRIIKQKKGFSFIELIIAFSVGTLLLMSFYSLEIAVRRNFIIDSAIMENHSSARTAMDWLTKDIRQATQIEQVAHTINGVSYQSSNTQLVLDIPAYNSDGALDPADSDYIAYRVLNTTTASGKKVNTLERVVQPSNLSNRPNATRTFIISETLATVASPLLFESSGAMLANYADKTTLSDLTITLVTTKSTLLGENVDETLRSTVKLRNR